MRLHKILNFVNKKVAIFHLKYFSYEQQFAYLNRFPSPKDDIERSYFQYKCQKFLRDGFFVALLKNVFSFIITIFYLIKIRDKSEIQNTVMPINVLVGTQALFNFLPKKYSDHEAFIQLEFMDRMSLSVADRKIVYMLIRRYPLSWYFVLKITMKLAHYSSIIDRYNPQNILVSCEYSFTSSILTYYCESRNIKHINFMHGEKIYDITDAFCHFTEFYVWDNHYIELFRLLKSSNAKYIVEIPMYFIVKGQVSTKKILKKEKVCYKFYLANENKQTIEILSRIIFIIINLGKRVKVRPHPAYINQKLLLKFLDEKIIEDPYMIDINSSLNTTENVISIGSSVLYQAYLRNIPVIIDDVTNKKKYNYFKENKHIMHDKNHKLLSEVLANEH